MSQRLFAVLLLSCASAAAAQNACPTGPGAAFGVTAYQCANCGFKSAGAGRPSYQFFTEPVILQTSPTSVVRPGDVIEAINDKPITTADGADQFTYPGAGSHTVTVRRGRDRQVLRIAVADACGGDHQPISMDDIESIEILKGPAAMAEYGRDALNGVVVIRTKAGRTRAAALPGARDSGRIRLRGLADVIPRGTNPLIIVDGVVLPNVQGSFAAGNRTGRFGFAVSCEPSCTAATGTDGPLTYTYYKYDGLPAIVAIRDGSFADRAGLRVGDLVLKVDGHPIGSEEGAMAMARLERRDDVRLTIRRGEREVEFVLRVP